MNIALIAHDAKTELLVQFCIAYCGILSRHSLCATGTTGKMIAEATGADIQLYGGEEKVSDREIFIGNTSLQLGSHKTRVGEGGLYKVDGEILRRDGFVISTAGERYIREYTSEPS